MFIKMEVEIAPGIYLTKKPSEQAQQRTHLLHEQAVLKLKQNPNDYYAYLQQELQRVSKQIQVLKYSNNEMQEHLNEDKVFEQSIKENLEILIKVEKRHQDLSLELKVLGAQLGIKQTDLEPKVQQVEVAEGVFL